MRSLESKLLVFPFGEAQVASSFLSFSDLARLGANEMTAKSILEELKGRWARGRCLRRERVEAIASALQKESAYKAFDFQFSRDPEAVLGIALLFSEAAAPLRWLNTSLARELHFDIEAMTKVRNFQLRRTNERPDESTGQRAIRPLELQAPWIREWLRGGLNLVT
jgi:hypothetical protein